MSSGVIQTSPGPVWGIVVNWNQWERTERCLDSFAAFRSNSLVPVVVNNGSDVVSEAEARVRSRARVVDTTTNLGYAGGANRGIRVAMENHADFIWLLNNDVRITRGDVLQRMVSAMSDPSVGALTSRQRNERGENLVVANEVEVPPENERFVVIRCSGCEQGFHEAGMLMGASLFFRAAALRDTDLFDERYFHYYEEMDLIQRLRRCGWRVGLACQAEVFHEKGATLGESAQSHYYFVRNRLLYREKFFRESPRRILRQRTMLGKALELRQAVKTRNLSRTRAGVLAVADALRGRSGQRDIARA